MNDATRTALTSAATARASELCAEQAAFLAAGRKTFVKGKPVMVPFGADKRAQLKRLALGMYDDCADKVIPIILPFVAVEGVTEATEQAFIAECVSVYSAAGIATVEAAYA